MHKLDIQKLIEKHKPKDIDELNRLVNAEMHRLNDAPIADFCGLSPNQMTLLLNAPFSETSPFGYKDFDPAVLNQSPFFLLAEDILQCTVLKTNPFNMTASTASLPVSTVKELYKNLTLKDESIENGFNKLYKETDCPIIHVCKIVLESSSIVRKQHGKWYLTKKGEKLVLIEQREALFKEVFQTFALKYNWGYLDGYSHPNSGQMGFAFSLSLLSNCGETSRSSDYYVEKYKKAFPSILEQAPSTPYSTPARDLARSFNLRFIERFAYWWGLVEISQKQNLIIGSPLQLQKTKLLDLIFRVPVLKDME